MAKAILSVLFFVAATSVAIGAAIVHPHDSALWFVIGLAYGVCLFLSLTFMDKAMHEK